MGRFFAARVAYVFYFFFFLTFFFVVDVGKFYANLFNLSRQQREMALDRMTTLQTSKLNEEKCQIFLTQFLNLSFVQCFV